MFKRQIINFNFMKLIQILMNLFGNRLQEFRILILTNFPFFDINFFFKIQNFDQIRHHRPLIDNFLKNQVSFIHRSSNPKIN
jgi:hypothetical protein